MNGIKFPIVKVTHPHTISSQIKSIEPVGYYTYFTIDILNPTEIYLAEVLKGLKALFFETKDNGTFYEGSIFRPPYNQIDELIKDAFHTLSIGRRHEIFKHLFSRNVSFSVLNSVSELFRIDEHIKWYEHEKDMRWLSLKTPNIVWSLHGEGEETGDLWQKYFKNGKMQVAQARIEYDDYDEKELK